MQFQLNEWYEITAAVGPQGGRDMVVSNLVGRATAITDSGVTLVVPGHGSVATRHEHIQESRCTSLDEVVNSNGSSD